MPRVIDASQLSFGEGLAAGFFNTFDSQALGQQVADKVFPPKLTPVTNVGDREISVDSGGSFFLDGVRQRELPRGLIELADREHAMKRQAASDLRAESAEQRAVSAEKRAVGREQRETTAFFMGIQDDAVKRQFDADQRSFQREQWEHTRRTWATEQNVQKAEKAAYAPLNQQYVAQRLQGAQRLGAQVDPAVADSLSAASEFMPPDKFKTIADSMFTAAMQGQDTSRLSAEIMEGYATSIAAQTRGRVEVASMGTKEALRELTLLQKDDEPDMELVAEAKSLLRQRQTFEQIAVMRQSIAWQPGLPRSLTKYDQTIGAAPGSSRVEQYWNLAMLRFQMLYGYAPNSPEGGYTPGQAQYELMQVKQIAEQMAAEDGWTP